MRDVWFETVFPILQFHGTERKDFWEYESSAAWRMIPLDLTRSTIPICCEPSCKKSRPLCILLQVVCTRQIIQKYCIGWAGNGHVPAGCKCPACIHGLHIISALYASRQCLHVFHRSVSHLFVSFPSHKRTVWYTTCSDYFGCGILEFSKISHWNGCGEMRAAAVTWHFPISPTGGWLIWRVLACPRPVCKNILEEILECLYVHIYVYIYEKFKKYS